MDTPEIRKGSTVYLGVNVEGAMLSFGDGHARQSEGETCGVAVECAMDSQIIVELVKGTYTAWPRIEMVKWTSELLSISTMDAYQLVTQTVLTPIANACDKVYTAVCKMPTKFLPPLTALGGMHQQLRAVAAR